MIIFSNKLLIWISLLFTLPVPPSFQTYIKQKSWISSGLNEPLYQKVKTKATKSWCFS